MRARQLHELNAAVVKKDAAKALGFVEACALLDEMYSSCSTHKYLLGDCLLWKVNLLASKRRIRINKRRAKEPT